MRRILCALIVVLMLAVPALAANTDSFARTQLNSQTKQIETLQAQVKALTVLVEQQKASLAALQQKVDNNLTLIKALAKALEQGRGAAAPGSPAVN